MQSYVAVLRKRTVPSYDVEATSSPSGEKVFKHSPVSVLNNLTHWLAEAMSTVRPSGENIAVLTTLLSTRRASVHATSVACQMRTVPSVDAFKNLDSSVENEAVLKPFAWRRLSTCGQWRRPRP